MESGDMGERCECLWNSQWEKNWTCGALEIRVVMCLFSHFHLYIC